jgi:hypothetical protein
MPLGKADQNGQIIPPRQNACQSAGREPVCRPMTQSLSNVLEKRVMMAQVVALTRLLILYHSGRCHRIDQKIAHTILYFKLDRMVCNCFLTN